MPRGEDELPTKQDPPDTIFQVKEMSNNEVIEFIERSREGLELFGDEYCFLIPSRKDNHFFHNGRIVLRNENFKNVKACSKKGKEIQKLLQHIDFHCKMKRHFSKRSVYYTFIGTFSRQEDSDELLNDVACLVGCTRDSLMVQAASKGAVAGNLCYFDGMKNVDCTKVNMHGQIVPQMAGEITNMNSEALFILLVEKDSVFERLVEARFFDRFKCIILTGRGYADVSTRMFLRKLKTKFKLPVLALMDYDPHGINIMTVFKFGSKNMAYDNENLATPDIKWIGIRKSDLVDYNIPEKCKQPMSEEVLERGKNLAKEDFMTGNKGWLAELLSMIEDEKVVEIEALDSLGPNFLMDVYLPRKLSERDWI